MHKTPGTFNACSICNRQRTAGDASQLGSCANVVHDGGAREGAGGGVAVEGRAHQVGQA